jgi:uncharacterized membrane protein
MYALRRLSLPAHALVELSAGLALVVAALALSLGVAGTLALFTAGVILAGIGLGAVDALPLAAHQSLDRLTATLMAAGSVGLALAGEATGALVLLAVAAGQLMLAGVTRWTRPLPAR